MTDSPNTPPAPADGAQRPAGAPEGRPRPEVTPGGPSAPQPPIQGPGACSLCDVVKPDEHALRDHVMNVHPDEFSALYHRPRPCETCDGDDATACGCCPACDTPADERCAACGRCRCDRHDQCGRRAPTSVGGQPAAAPSVVRAAAVALVDQHNPAVLNEYGSCVHAGFVVVLGAGGRARVHHQLPSVDLTDPFRPGRWDRAAEQERAVDAYAGTLEAAGFSVERKTVLTGPILLAVPATGAR